MIKPIYGSLKKRVHGNLRAILTDELGGMITAAFDAITGSSLVTPTHTIADDHHSSTWVDESDLAADTYYYPPGGYPLGRHDQITLTVKVRDATALDFEVWNGASTDSNDAKSIAKMGLDTTTGQYLTGAITEPDSAVVIYDIDFQNINFDWFRVKYQTPDTSDSGVIVLRKKSRKV